MWGDAEDFPDGPDVAVARARLVPSWGARIRLVSRSGDELVPVFSATVLADGVPAGRTDRQGMLELRRDAEPARIEIRCPPFEEVVPGEDFDPSTGRLLGTPLVRTLELR